MNCPKTFFELYTTFAKIGSVTFGGGMAMMPVLQRELIEKRNWMTEEEMLDYYAIGQSTPGIIAVNVSTFIGFKKAGILGGIIATLGMITPSIIIISLIASFISSVNHLPLAQKALKGINVAVAALLTSVVLEFSKKTIKNFMGAVTFLLSFFLIFFLKVPTYFVIIFSLIFGIIIFLINSKSINSKIKTKETSEANND